MLSITNPYVALALVFTILASFGTGYYKGGEAENEKQQLEIARLNAEARQKEQALVESVTNTANQLVKVNNDAKIQIQKRDAAIASGNLKLRIPVKAPECAVSTSTDTPTPSGDSVQTTAELDRETAKALVAITDQGDANTRQLNACIDAYNEVRNSLMRSNK